MITVACVLKSGGDYTPEYVSRLHSAVRRHMTEVYHFVCITDMEVDCDSIPLIDSPELPFWWAKLELFTLKPPVLYFDLDTVIVDSLKPFCELPNDFYMVRSFKHGGGASQILLINTDMTFIYDEFIYELDNGGKFVTSPHEVSAELSSGFYRGDQDYIFPKAKEWVEVSLFQDVISGIYSYKHHCRTELPSNARVVCFHGRPRPHEAHSEWVKEHWR